MGEGDTMLSSTERKRLSSRSMEGMDSQIKASNDSRVRKKLAMWLNEDLYDVFLSLELPEDQLKRIFNDHQVFMLLYLVKKMLELLDFRAIYGELDNPDGWKVPNKPGEVEPNRLIEDQDIWRAFFLGKHIDGLLDFYGRENPFSNLALIMKMDADKDLHDRVTEGERKGLERVKLALKNVSDEILEKDSARVKELDLHLNPPHGTLFRKE
jgi:hypothetical protein